MQNQPHDRKTPIEQAKELASSEAGQQLLHSLQKNRGTELDHAFQLAAAGDYGQLKTAVEKLLEMPEAKAILEKMKG